MKTTKTQIESYHKIDFKSKLQRRVYYYLKAFPNKSSQEIADVLHLRRTSVIARLNELKQMRLIEVSEIKENRNTSRKNEYYSIVTDFYSALDAVQFKMIFLTQEFKMLEYDYNKVKYSVSRSIIASGMTKNKKQFKELERAEKILTQLIQKENTKEKEQWRNI